MTVVGRYRALNLADPYWGRPADATDPLAAVAIFTPAPTFALLGANRATLTIDLLVTRRPTGRPTRTISPAASTRARCG